MTLTHIATDTTPGRTPADIIDAHCKSLIDGLNACREAAAGARRTAERWDARADLIRAELGDWNRVRAAALAENHALALGTHIADAADRILEPVSGAPMGGGL